MYLLLFKLILLYFVVQASTLSDDNDDLPKLSWGRKYSLEGERWSLTGGWVEDFKYWRNSRQSRVDYNNGAVKNFAFKGSRRKSAFLFGVKYSIIPETTKETKNKLVCTQHTGDILNNVKLDKILPDVSELTYVGKDLSGIRNIHKFKYELKDYEYEQINTLWAELSENKTWIPIKYEEIKFNSWLGSLSEHAMWHFYSFKTTVDDDVFKIDRYGCNSSIDDIATMYDDRVTRDLLFIDPEDKRHVEHVFTTFTQKHNKVYNDEHERETRKSIFRKNLRRIIANNRNNTGFKLGVTKFTDRTPEELKRMTGLLPRKKEQTGTERFPYSSEKIKEISSELPEEFDHRLYGRITPVKEQEDCGSCWTFGTSSAVEGALAIKNGGRLIRLSNQVLLDCAWGFGGSGCEGGSDTASYKWMMKYGLPTEEEYGPYENKEGFCHIENMTTIYPIRGFVDVTPFSVNALKVALVNHGPQSVSIDATDLLFLYTGGTFYDTSCSTTTLNHEVTLVGYGSNDGEDYWIVKNSWGTDWGIDGYFHISMRDNNCGITTEPTYVVL